MINASEHNNVLYWVKKMTYKMILIFVIATHYNKNTLFELCGIGYVILKEDKKVI